MSSFGEFNCIFCKETFDDKETLQIHFRKHGDPKYNQQKKLGDRKMSDDKCNEPAEMVSCDVCPEVFPTISKAITHKHKVHPDHDAKYFCLWCGKLFTMKHLYNKHMQANHANMQSFDGMKTFRCDCCEVDFLAAPAMLCHNKFFHRSDTDLPSVGLSKKQKLYSQESIPLYYCPFCGEEYENKVNLHKHMGDDHADENQSPDEVLRCPLCEALFYHLDAYEIHLTFHTAKDCYSDYNEKRHQIPEYSLEIVAPIVEKVENYEQPSNDGEDASSAMGIDQFLQLAMDDNDNGQKKSKKHKKHKKSKKNTITLDEFLNMNKDMFGEEVDVHGIEEVPTTAVARRLKPNKKPPQKLKKPASKFVPSDIQKLKLQGIVVKKKPVVNTFITQTNTPAGKNKTLKISQKLLSKNIKPEVQNKMNTNSLSTSNEVLSKLLNQSNNQIKIVKKSAQPSINAGEDYPNISEDNRKQDDLVDKCSESEHTDTEDPAEDALQMNENTLKLISQSKESESTSKLDRLESKEGIDSNLIFDDDLKSGNQETNQILSSTDKDTADNSGDKIPKDQSTRNTEHTSEEEEEINNLDRESKDGDRDEESKAIFTENNSDLLPQMDEDKYNEGMRPETENNSTSESLSALKHLSHLITIKPVTKNTIDDKGHDTVTAMDTSITKQLDYVPSISDNSDKAQINQTPNVNKQQKSVDYLKNINKNISIKSLNQSSNTCKRKYNEDVCSEEEIEPKTSISGRNTPVTTDSNKSHVNTTQNIKNSTTQSPISKLVIKSIADKPNKELLQDKTTGQVNANLLKRLTNITAKPLYSSKELPKEVEKQSNKNIAKKIVSKEIDEGIEIFNIDDSDSDSDNDKEEIKRNMDFQVSKPPTESIDALKNLSKHITIKNMRQEISKTIEREESVQEACENKMNTFSEHKQFISKTFQSCSNKSDPTSANHKNSALNNLLKNVGKNITVKSGTHSPSQTVTSQDNNIHYENNENSDDSDTDFYPGKVKITEIENDDQSDHEIDDKQEIQTQDDAYSQHVQVQSPDGSWSDREGSINEDMMEEDIDLETQINVNKLKKPKDFLPASKGKSTSLHNLKGISKDITIKSVNEKKCQSRTDETTENDTNKELVVKPFKQVKVEQGNKCSNTSSRVETFNNANNQTNTINKEVTVKTFQTQTVIQEITTTVTKTIRTVNQTVNQFQSHSSSKSMIQPQRIVGMRPIHVGRNLQGVTVGHRSPNIGCKIRNATPSPRPVVRNPGPPSNQLAVVRPRLNTPRQNAPRMAVLQRAPTTPNQSRPVKNLKISPHVITSSVNKRQSSEEPSGPFSCFKKPKETLYPAPDLPSICNSSNMPNIQYSSSSQSSKSNVTTTKVMKGNSVVSSTHMKSEASATSQQLSKLSNLSGLKIVKTNQRQEHVQEKSETSANRTTLDTIEKLQKQGLLVKKPRLDDNEVSNHSEPEDDYADYSSTEENN